MLGNIFRDHRKLLLVDDRGHSWAAPASPMNSIRQPISPASGETMVEIRGPVLTDWQALFLEVESPGPRTGDAAAVVPAAGGRGRGRVTFTRGLLAQEIKHQLFARLRGAHARCGSPRPISSRPEGPAPVARAARRGADVRLLLPGPVTDHPAARHAGRHL